MLNGLFQRPVAKANDVAVVGISEEAGDAFGTAQLNIDVGVGGGTEGQGGKRKYGEFGARSEERSVGKECVSKCRSRWSTEKSKENQRSSLSLRIIRLTS